MTAGQPALAIAATIATTDSGGGAGIPADLKTFAACGVYGVSVAVALTAQNTLGVRSVHSLPLEFVHDQFEALDPDLRPAATKTGMLLSAAHISQVCSELSRRQWGPLVVDPVMVAKSGDRLLEESAVETMRRQLLPLAQVVTPNWPEAAALSGLPVETEAQALSAGRAIAALGVEYVVVKGGHSPGEPADLVVHRDQVTRLPGWRVATQGQAVRGGGHPGRPRPGGWPWPAAAFPQGLAGELRLSQTGLGTEFPHPEVVSRAVVGTLGAGQQTGGAAMKFRQKQRPIERLGTTAGDAAGAVVEVIGSGVRSASEAVGPALSAVSQQLPEVANRIATSVQPAADTAQKRAAEVLALAKDRSAEFADLVIQAAYEATKSLPADARKRVERSLRKTGIEPPRRRRRVSKAWLAGGLLAAAGVAFLFSGTVQDRVYDVVDRIRGEDEDGAGSRGPAGAPASGPADTPAPDSPTK